MGVVIGVVIGQKREPSALCVAETEERQRSGRIEEHFVVRHLERLSLGISYPELASRLAEAVAAAQRHAAKSSPDIFIDATGIGQPVIDILSAEVPSAWMKAVYFNHGDRRREESGVGVQLGKAWLVSRLQALLQTGRLHLPRTAEARALAQELCDFEIRVGEDANERYGAFRVGAQDDSVTALGLAVQVDPPRWCVVTPRW
jgi:hypothetical protein